ncbi:hypothetical protein OSB04_031494 [Centaurea solstitialis]|uniref:Uncharacterized protein n=1 Tax=Centaurea solstitialis TaxID=347529 RepID=A0AA38W861_9ASTR|nr:hypothetical protein OSB04_031494 [Centaurea solstitialis]
MHTCFYPQNPLNLINPKPPNYLTMNVLQSTTVQLLPIPQFNHHNTFPVALNSIKSRSNRSSKYLVKADEGRRPISTDFLTHFKDLEDDDEEEAELNDDDMADIDWDKVEDEFSPKNRSKREEEDMSYERDPEFAEILGTSLDDPSKAKDKIAERLKRKKDKILQRKTGSATPMSVTFNKFEFSNSYIWIEFYHAPLDKDIKMICDTIRSWHIVGRLGGCNSMNMQLSQSMTDKRPSYDDIQGANVEPSTFYNIGDLELQDNLHAYDPSDELRLRLIEIDLVFSVHPMVEILLTLLIETLVHIYYFFRVDIRYQRAFVVGHIDKCNDTNKFRVTMLESNKWFLVDLNLKTGGPNLTLEDEGYCVHKI